MDGASVLAGDRMSAAVQDWSEQFHQGMTELLHLLQKLVPRPMSHP
jgi:hypothetical protein